jgi:hypothetical protein
MKRKRAPGGGRKARAGPTSSLTFRIPDDMRKQLEREAAEKEVNVSDRLLWHLRRSFNRQRDEERDPALQALLVVIARLAEDVTGGELMPNKDVRSQLQRRWRTDLFQFRAFKFAVKKLLDTLEEPPSDEHELTEEQREQFARESAEHFGDSPEFTTLFLSIHKSPEAMGGWVFGNLWKRFTHSHLPFTENERRMMVEDPVLGVAMKREYYDFQKARKALELKPKPSREDLFEATKRIMKDRNLDPETEPAPPDIQEAMKFIADKGRAFEEAIAANKLSAREALKLLESDPLPTLDQALKLIKIRKPKGQSR